MQKLLLSLIIIFATLLYSPHNVKAITLDPRIGTIHVGGNYPDRHVQGDYLVWGGKKALELGFSGLEIFLSSNMCYNYMPNSDSEYWRTNQNPYGPYQAGSKYCQPAPNNRVSIAKTLTELATHPDFHEYFSLPLKNFFLTAYPFARGSALINKKIVSGAAITQTEVDTLYQEYYDFAGNFFEKYKDQQKRFFIMPMVTMDRWLTNRDNPEDKLLCSEPVPQERITNMRLYFSTISKAIKQAQQDKATPSSPKVYLVCEVNNVLCNKEQGGQSALTDVVPYSGCDLTSYAAYETAHFSFVRNDPTLIKKALSHMADNTPDHPDFAHRNVFISEIGIQENRAEQFNFEYFTENTIRQALNWGTPFIQIWGLGSCVTFNPGSSEQSDPLNCTGMWMFRPDNSLSKMYNFLKSNFTVTSTPTPLPSLTPSIAPSPSPSPSASAKPGDLNTDGSVNLLDFNLLISLFGNPYTILDFNAILSNYGK